jgi:sulfite reductase (NADPH) hemoprotein beta-component
MEENGLRNDHIVMRMSGCANVCPLSFISLPAHRHSAHPRHLLLSSSQGCSRPWPAEIAFVGKAPGFYTMLLGGGYHGQRLAKIIRESVNEVEIIAILKPLIKRYALERHEGEHFGDFVIRIGVVTASEPGAFYAFVNILYILSASLTFADPIFPLPFPSSPYSGTPLDPAKGISVAA